MTPLSLRKGPWSRPAYGRQRRLPRPRSFFASERRVPQHMIHTPRLAGLKRHLSLSPPSDQPASMPLAHVRLRSAWPTEVVLHLHADPVTTDHFLWPQRYLMRPMDILSRPKPVGRTIPGQERCQQSKPRHHQQQRKCQLRPLRHLRLSLLRHRVRQSFGLRPLKWPLPWTLPWPAQDLEGLHR